MTRQPGWLVHYPRSFLKLIIAGFALVALPLILAIVNNALSIHDIVERSQQTVHQAMRATEASRALREQLTAMERSVRQASALADPGLLQGYTHARGRFTEGARQMRTLGLDTRQAEQLARLVAREETLAQSLEASAAAPDTLADRLAGFEELDGLARSLADIGNGVVEREIAALQAKAESVQRFISWQLVALLPIAMVLLVGAIVLISRPIGQIDAAMRRMADGNFDAPVQVAGPQDLQNLGRQLDRMRLRLIDLEGQKRQFLHQVSHELKTPLAAIREGAGLLDEQLVGPLTPPQREVTSILLQNTGRLQDLIERLLSYHQTQFHRTALTIGTVALREIVGGAGRQHRLSMAAKGLRFAVTCPPVSVEGDADKLSAILSNLISNAVKYAPRNGGIGVTVTDLGETVRLEVADDGPGIRPEERDHVFEPFYRGSAAYEGPLKGTGLGLAIVREFVLAHHGHIDVVPQEQGARLRVELPRRQPQREAT